MLELGAVLLVLLLLLLLPLATDAWLLIKERKMHLSWLLTQLHLVHSVVSPSPQLCGGLCSAGCWLLVLPRQLPRSLHRIWSRLGENEAKCLNATRKKNPKLTSIIFAVRHLAELLNR